VTAKDHDQASDARAGETSVFRANFVDKPDTWSPVAGQGPPPGSAPLLVVTRGPDAGSRLVLDKAVTCAGRHPDSDIFLDDVTVSRRHAEFQATENNDVQIVDVGSLNGTYVNRQPVDSAKLVNGDEVQIGKFRLVFLTGGPQAAT
jgi:pSer/pThr/pTyr-binding forkhead associated (FHA) protein